MSTTNRTMSEVGRDFGIAWWTVHRVLVAAAADVLGSVQPNSVIGAGTSEASVEAWLSLQDGAFARVVATDRSASYAAGIRRALPHARIVLDHFHLVMLANTMLTEIRQRVQRLQHARGAASSPASAHRRLLLRAGDNLSPEALARPLDGAGHRRPGRAARGRGTSRSATDASPDGDLL